jgi:hypothetical protein
MRHQGKKESSHDLSYRVTFWSTLIMVIILIFLSLCGLVSCSEVEHDIVPRNKVGCTCKDGTYIVWDENLLKQTGWLTGNPCWDKGGIISYTYSK